MCFTNTRDLTLREHTNVKFNVLSIIVFIMNHELNICMKLERKTQRQIRQFRVSELELAMGSTCGCDAVEKDQEQAQEKREEEE